MSDDEHRLSSRSHFDADIEMTRDRGLGPAYADIGFGPAYTDIEMTRDPGLGPAYANIGFGAPYTDIEMTRDRGLGPADADDQQNNDASTHHPSMYDDNGNAAHFTYPELYRAAATGDVVMFRRSSEDLESSHHDLKELKSPQGDTVLHIAAQHGHDELVRVILGRHDLYPLIVTPNMFQNTPLHVAAASGHLSTVKILVSVAREIPQQLGASSSSTTTSTDPTAGDQATIVVRFLLRSQNKENNTAFHLALRNRREDVARFLFEEDPEVAHCASPEFYTPLFMAAEVGYEALFEAMMRQPVTSELPADTMRQYRTLIVLGAILAKNKGILNLVLRDWPEVFSTNARREILHPIFLAVFIGYLEGVRNILIKFRETSFFANIEGSYPIHLAATEGHLEILQEFLKQCPDSRELRNKEFQTILHLAAKNGRAKLVSYILKNHELQMLINDKDGKGNTPLHLATKGGHAKVVGIMTWDTRVDLEILDGKGKTALDVAEGRENWYELPSFRQRLTWQALRNTGAPRAKDLSSYRTKLSGPRHFKRTPISRTNTTNVDFYKDRTNTFMLVSTLIITITFAAGLMSPGSDNDSEPNPTMFHVFVIANTIALYSSITVVVTLIWAQLGDRELVIASFKLALPVLGLALAMVSIAFMAGAYLVASNLSVWLANSVLVLGVIGFLAFFLLFAPIFSPNSFQRRFVRYIIYYPFHLLIKVTDRDTNK